MGSPFNPKLCKSKKATYIGVLIGSYFLSVMMPIPLEISMFVFFCALFLPILGKKIVFGIYFGFKIHLLPNMLVALNEITQAIGNMGLEILENLPSDKIVDQKALTEAYNSISFLASNELQIIIAISALFGWVLLSLGLIYFYAKIMHSFRIFERIKTLL